jgi:ADP-ribose pyrophosphatase YjhB (NUDIX family)
VAWFVVVAMFDGWTVCPRCANQLTHSPHLVECPACGFFLYAHSAVTASALPEDGAGHVLLARRAVDPCRGRWDLVGGFLAEGEHPLDGLRRELREETGQEFEPDRFLGVWTGDYGGRATLNLFWTGRFRPGDLTAADDVAELRWFSAGELPQPEELAFSGLISSVLDVWRDEHAERLRLDPELDR